MDFDTGWIQLNKAQTYELLLPIGRKHKVDIRMRGKGRLRMALEHLEFNMSRGLRALRHRLFSLTRRVRPTPRPDQIVRFVDPSRSDWSPQPQVRRARYNLNLSPIAGDQLEIRARVMPAEPEGRPLIQGLDTGQALRATGDESTSIAYLHEGSEPSDPSPEQDPLINPRTRPGSVPEIARRVAPLWVGLIAYAIGLAVVAGYVALS